MALRNGNVSYTAFLSLDAGNSTGSGFQLYFRNKHFIITAKHVLFDETSSIRCKSLLITFQNHIGEREDSKTIVSDDISAMDIIKSPSLDIVAISLENEDLYRIEQQGNNIIHVTENDIGDLDSIEIGNNILLVGFPTSLIIENTRFFDIDRPLLRKGIIAGINSKNSTFIIDCPVFYGNSGGPVIEYRQSGEMKLIGIVSKYIPFVTEWKNNRKNAFVRQEFSNSGYAVCIPISEIIKKLID